MSKLRSYRFESYIWITAESEARARERLELIFESSSPEWEVADVEDVVETYVCPSCDREHPVGFVCEDQVR